MIRFTFAICNIQQPTWQNSCETKSEQHSSCCR